MAMTHDVCTEHPWLQSSSYHYTLIKGGSRVEPNREVMEKEAYNSIGKTTTICVAEHYLGSFYRTHRQ